MFRRVQAGPTTRTRAMQRQYVEYLKTLDTNECPFCDIAMKQPESLVKDGKYTQIIKNGFAYSVWEGCRVLDHLMIIPTKHRHVLADLTHQEKNEWIDTCATYEEKGYSLYTRSPDSITKSIGHHHTHFIKLESKRKSFMFYLRKPHIMLTK